MDEMMRRLPHGMFPGRRGWRALACLAAALTVCGLGLTGCEAPRRNGARHAQSAGDDWRPIGMLTSAFGEKKFCALRSVPAAMLELGVEKAWRVQCGLLPPIPGKLVHRGTAPGRQVADDDLRRMLADGAWATYGMAQLDCGRGKTTVTELRIDGKPTKGALLGCEVKASSLSTLPVRNDTYGLPPKSPSASEPHRDRRSVTAFAVRDEEGVYLGYVEQGCIDACGSPEANPASVIGRVLDAARDVDPNLRAQYENELTKLAANEAKWREDIRIAGDYHDFGLYSNAVGKYSDANLNLFINKGVQDPSRADVLLQLALNLSDMGQMKSAEDTFQEAESLLWDIKKSKVKNVGPYWESIASDVLLPLKAYQYCVVHKSNQIAMPLSGVDSGGKKNEKPENKPALGDNVGILINQSKSVESAYCEFINKDGALIDMMPNQPSSCSCARLAENKSNTPQICSDTKSTVDVDPWKPCENLLRGAEGASSLDNRIFLDSRIPQARYALSEMLYNRSLLEDVRGGADEAERLRTDARHLLANTGLSHRSTEARLRQASALSHLAAGRPNSALSDVAFALKTLEGLKPAPNSPKNEGLVFDPTDVGEELRRLPQAEARLIFLAAQAQEMVGSGMADDPAMEKIRDLFSKAEAMYYSPPSAQSQPAMSDELYRLGYRFRRGLSDHAVGAYLDHLYRDFEHADGPARKSLFEAMFRVAQLQKLGGLQLCRPTSPTSKEQTVLNGLCDSLQAIAELVNAGHLPLDRQGEARTNPQQDQRARTELLEKAKELPSQFDAYCKENPAGCAQLYEQVVEYGRIQDSMTKDESFLLMTPTPSNVYMFLVPKNGDPWMFRADLDARRLNEFARVVWNSASDTESISGSNGGYKPKPLEDLAKEDPKHTCSFGSGDRAEGYVCAAGIYETLFRQTVGTPIQGGASGTLSDLTNDTPLLSIVAGGDLGRIPFSILPTDRKALKALIKDGGTAPADKWPWLIWTHATAYAPTVATYVHSRSMPYPQSMSYSVFANPITPSEEQFGAEFEAARCRADTTRFGSGIPTDADKIAPAIAPYFPATRPSNVCRRNSKAVNICERDEDTIENLKKVAAENSGGYIHLYTHGIGSNLLTCVHEASILMSPSKVAEGRYHFLLKESGIMGMTFNGAMVVSQACDIVRGDDYWVGPSGWDGLAKSFLFAGARGFIGSYWQSNYESANELMLRLFELIGRSKMAPWRALWESQKSISQTTSKNGTSWSHPHYWGNFTIGGNPM